MAGNSTPADAAAAEIAVEGKRIEVGRKLEQFINDPDIAFMLATLGTTYYRDFKQAKTDDDLRLAKAQSNVLDDFVAQFQVGIDRGTVASRSQRLREEAEDRKRSRKKPS